MLILPKVWTRRRPLSRLILLILVTYKIDLSVTKLPYKDEMRSECFAYSADVR